MGKVIQFPLKKASELPAPDPVNADLQRRMNNLRDSIQKINQLIKELEAIDERR